MRPKAGLQQEPWTQLIFTEADDINELHGNIREAVDCHFEPDAKPKMIRLHFVREEVIAA